MSLELTPFADAHLVAAAELLAARHSREREREPALAARFATSDVAAAAVVATWSRPDAYGVAALRDDRLVGFLIGAPELADAVWGRSVWMRWAGHALSPDADADLYRDLYAALAPHFMALGCFAHFVELPAADRPILEAWYALSFGQQQAYAVRSLVHEAQPLSPASATEPGIVIRRATPADAETLATMQGILFDHLGRSPVYSVRLPEARRGWSTEFAVDLADPHFVAWLAVREADEEVLGAVVFHPKTPDDASPDMPEHCCYLAGAATRTEARGLGIARMLTAHGLAHAQAEGYASCLTDWRTTNLPASRLWPRLGFRPFEYRLARLIDERIAWAPGVGSWTVQGA